MGKIILYTIDCPKCVILEKKLKEKNIAFDTIKDENIMKEKGLTLCPVLQIREKGKLRLLDFNQAISWLKENKE